MNSYKFKIAVSVIISINFLATNPVSCQVNETQKSDSLTLTQVIKEVIQNYPTIKESEEALNTADAKIGLAKSGYYPDIDFNANFSHIGPVPTLTFPTFGSFQLYPENNYSSSVNYRQNIYDFGKTAKNVSAENVGKELSIQSLSMVKQRLTISVISNFYTILYLQKAISIKQQQLNTLNEHLDFVNKKKDTGSAIEYEIISTQVKLSGVESQKLDIEAALKIQASILNSFLGKPNDTPCEVTDKLTVILPQIQKDSILTTAYNHRDEMIMAQTKVNLAEIRYDLIKTQNYPVLSLIVQGGFKNGYVPDLNKFQANYVAGIGLRVPIFEATRTKYNRNIAKSSVLTSNLETDITKRNISNEVIESETNLEVAQKKVNQFEMQLKQAQKALSLANVSYSAGAITNLDLLDATTTVSECQLMLLKSKIDYTLSIYKLNAAIGERLY